MLIRSIYANNTISINKVVVSKQQHPTSSTIAYTPNATQHFTQPKLTAKDIELAIGMTAEESFAIWDEKNQKKKETWKDEFENWFNADISAIKEASKGKAVSVFNKDEISSDTKEFLKDKPITAVRYQRLYEQDPEKADLFIKNIMKNGNYGILTNIDLDEKYRGQDYLEVLEHINSLLEKNISDIKNGFTSQLNIYQRLFDIDDCIGSEYQAIRSIDGAIEVQYPGSNIWEIPEVENRSYVLDKSEYETGKFSSTTYVKLYKPIGISENGTVLIRVSDPTQALSDKGCHDAIDTMQKSMSYSVRYAGIY